MKLERSMNHRKFIILCLLILIISKIICENLCHLREKKLTTKGTKVFEHFSDFKFNIRMRRSSHKFLKNQRFLFTILKNLLYLFDLREEN